MRIKLSPSPLRDVRPQEKMCQIALNDAAENLERAAHLLSGSQYEHLDVLTSTLRAVRQSYLALLEWHGLTLAEDATLDELARPAENLASILRTCRDRAQLLEPLEADLRRGGAETVARREGTLASFYTARNTLQTVLGELPDRVGRAASARVHRTEIIRIARLIRTKRQQAAPDRSPRIRSRV